jgi:pimeloyl-ACP methyl ester carboxylesterase
MAAQYAARHPGAAQGVVLWGAYPPSSASLAESPLAVASIFGTNDGLATPAKILASHSLLPPTTTWVEIDGGNHAQFGWYGPQTGDGLASVSRAEQQSQAVQATIALLRSLAPGP